MSKNSIHNFNLSIKNSADIKSSEHLTKTIIKELAKVSKEMGEQKDIVQMWQEQKNQNAALVANNFNSLSGEGAINTTDKTIKLISNTSSDSEEKTTNYNNMTSSTLIEGGVTDNSGKTTTSSSASENNTPSNLRVENNTLNFSHGATSQTYASVASQQTITVPQTVDADSVKPTIKAIKATIRKKLNAAIKKNLTAEIAYWRNISKAFQQGAKVQDFNGKDGQELFTKMYFELQKWRLAIIEQDTINNINWTEVSDFMVLKLLQLSKEETNENLKGYYNRMIREIKNPDVNIHQLFSEHDELFLLLKSVFPNLPGKITIQSKKVIYPDLSPQKMYPDIGVENMYFIWSRTLLNEVEIKYGKGEIKSDIYFVYPPLKTGQWYDYDRIKNPTKEGSTFWNASLYNTINGQHYFYHTIAQRHAYYQFVDAYLKTKGIISEWFDAAARVTMGSIKTAIDGEMALGASEMPLNLWFLSNQTDEFLKGGNRYLFSDNMNNVKLLLEGKGKLSGEFIDAKGNKQSFKNLSQQELDFKLVEFEQSVVQDFINSSFDNLNNSFLKKSLDEVSETTGNRDFDAIIEQINDNFTLWMAPDLSEDIMQKHFTKNGKSTFNFAKYDDRVKLGQVMVKELYYLKLRDAFKMDTFDKILKDPMKNSIETFKYFRIDQKTAVKEESKHLKDYKLLERLSRIKSKLTEKSIYILSNLDEVVILYLNTKISKIEEIIYSITDIGEEVVDDLTELYYEINEEFEKTRINDHYSKIYVDVIENLHGDINEIHKIRENLRGKIGEKIIEKGIKIGAKIAQEITDLPNEIAGSVLAKTAERIYSGVKKLNENDKQLLFTKSYEATVAILLYEFATGEGLQNRNFDFHQHKFAQAILENRMIKEIMEETLKLLRQTNYDFVNKPDSQELKIDLEFSPTLTYAIESLDKHFDSNLAQIFIGGAFALVRIRNAKLEGYVYNETSRESLLLHLSIGDLKRKGDQSEERRLSSIVQRIYFTFNLPKEIVNIK
ncbi:hypothetical protein KHA90_21555 [Flavobacterium psychroterrae]|uniref:Uncharacterized protein n=1 Tax=Flavobacterium psychroterrae TaxID=2133767 RepID=A0ABS5PH49_9FLAO|nr:hypothetical protein [Flavobacterium psychroterrae]MBS7233604.1 hypothetical protein [Flavobacterium psychroterrae]